MQAFVRAVVYLIIGIMFAKGERLVWVVNASNEAALARMNRTLSGLYRRYRTVSLVVVTGLVMLTSFLWYLPGAYHASTMDEYHNFSWREYKFTNVLDLYVLHNLDKHDSPNFILSGIGLDYPALLSILIRSAATMGVSDAVTRDVYRSSTPPQHPAPGNTNTPIGVVGDVKTPTVTANVPAYLVINYAVVLLFGIVTTLLIVRWPGARPWAFAASPVLLLYAGYNWDTIPIALSLAGMLMLKRSIERPDPGRRYNVWYELAGFSLITIAIWFKIFPVVFLAAALIDRGRRQLWRAGGIGVGSFLILSLLINLPLILANYTSWHFFLWFNTNRPVEPSSIWWLLFDTISASLAGRPDTTVTINILSFLAVGAGGLVIAAVAWRSARRSIMMPLSCLFLVWWLTFNKLYDPNFDIWLLFILAILAAPAWLNTSLIALAFTWYLTAIGGLSLLTLGASTELNHWYVTHVLVFMVLWRLIVLGIMIVWVGRKLVEAEHPVQWEEPLRLDGMPRAVELVP